MEYFVIKSSAFHLLRKDGFIMRKSVKCLTVFMALIMVLELMPTAVFAADSVSYINAGGDTQTRDGVTELTSSDFVAGTAKTIGTASTDTWYLVSGNITHDRSLIISGNVHLILKNGVALSVTGDAGSAGVMVNGADNSLTVYAQSTDTDTMGTLRATGGYQGAGIGGNQDAAANSAITINGGNVIATAGAFAAAIGAGGNGPQTLSPNTGAITINGGNVTATAEFNVMPAAAIGGTDYYSSGTIMITGGVVTATGNGILGVGIGSPRGKIDAITITGGIVNATGRDVGIGGSANSTEGSITIDISAPSSVTASGWDNGKAINIPGGTLSIEDESGTWDEARLAGIGEVTIVNEPPVLEIPRYSYSIGAGGIKITPTAASGFAFYYTAGAASGTPPASWDNISTINGAAVMNGETTIPVISEDEIFYVRIYKVKTADNMITGYVEGTFFTTLTAGSIYTGTIDVKDDGVTVGTFSYVYTPNLYTSDYMLAGIKDELPATYADLLNPTDSAALVETGWYANYSTTGNVTVNEAAAANQASWESVGDITEYILSDYFQNESTDSGKTVTIDYRVSSRSAYEITPDGNLQKAQPEPQYPNKVAYTVYESTASTVGLDSDAYLAVNGEDYVRYGNVGEYTPVPGATYDRLTNTLTLNNYNSGWIAASKMNLNIVLVGNNTVTSTGSGTMALSTNPMHNNTVNISGSGTLNVNNTGTSGTCYGILGGGDVNINSGTVNVNVAAAGYSYGIGSNAGYININVGNGASVTSGVAGGTSAANALFAGGINITGSAAVKEGDAAGGASTVANLTLMDVAWGSTVGGVAKASKPYVSIAPGAPPAAYAVTYAANGGSGTMISGTATAGITFKLPACMFTAPAGKEFKAWSIGGTEYAAGASYTFSANTTVTAVWKDKAAPPPPTTDPTPTPTPAQPKPAKAASVKTLPTLYLVRGKSVTLPAAVQPYNAANKKIKWKTSNKKVVSVNAATGKIRGVKTGKATLTVTTNDGKKKAQCRVTVVAKATKVKRLAAFKPVGLVVGKTVQVKPKVTPAKATGVVPKFTSSKKSVAVIDKAGVITALAPGKTTITVKAGGKTQRFTVTVGKVLPKKITLSKKTLSVKVKKTAKLTVKWKPSNVSPKTVTWTTSNKKIATVNKRGVVKGVRKGTVTITATAWNGKTAKCKVKVK